jgi:hypothetical protein
VLAGKYIMEFSHRASFKVLVGKKPEGKKLLGKPRRRWEHNIKMNVQEVGCRVVDWIKLAGTFDCGNEPLGFIKCREFLGKLQTG